MPDTKYLCLVRSGNPTACFIIRADDLDAAQSHGFLLWRGGRGAKNMWEANNV